MKITMDTAEKTVAEFRQQYGITLEKLCENTGVAKSTLIKIEAGRAKPQATTIFKINEYIKTVESGIVDY